MDLVNVAPSTPNVLLLKEYPLCRHCLMRQAGTIGKKKVAATDDDDKEREDKKCYLCKGLFERLDEIAKKTLLVTRQYHQFNTFVVGATLPTQLYEREDALRARLKIRGRESIKNHLTRELGTRIAKMLHKKADYSRPDLTINVVIGKDGDIETTARARPLALLCRYIKRERGLPQKAEKCPLCLGKGCNLCDGTGVADSESIESIMTRNIVKITGGQSPKFSWIGSEDPLSLVLGQGRPFYVKVSNPRVRKPRRGKFVQAGIEGRIVEVLDEVPSTQERFLVKTRIACSCDRTIAQDDIEKLKKSITGTQAKFENRSKMVVKRIHSVYARKTAEGELVLTIVADGGLPIKQFVGGEQYIDPNISSLLDAKCKCTAFDILKVDFCQL